MSTSCEQWNQLRQAFITQATTTLENEQKVAANAPDINASKSNACKSCETINLCGGAQAGCEAKYGEGWRPIVTTECSIVDSSNPYTFFFACARSPLLVEKDLKPLLSEWDTSNPPPQGCTGPVLTCTEWTNLKNQDVAAEKQFLTSQYWIGETTNANVSGCAQCCNGCEAVPNCANAKKACTNEQSGTIPSTEYCNVFKDDFLFFSCAPTTNLINTKINAFTKAWTQVNPAPAGCDQGSTGGMSSTTLWIIIGSVAAGVLILGLGLGLGLKKKKKVTTDEMKPLDSYEYSNY